MEEKTKLDPELKFLLIITPMAIVLSIVIGNWFFGDPQGWLL